MRTDTSLWKPTRSSRGDDSTLINKNRFLEIADRNGIDVLVAASKENVLYSTEYWSLSQWSDGTPVYAVLPVQSTPKVTLIAPMSDIDLAVDELCQVEEVFPYGTFHYEIPETLADNRLHSRLHELVSKAHGARSSLEALASALDSAGLDRGRIGIDDSTQETCLLGEIERLLPRAKLVPASTIFAQIRMVKTEEEIRRLKKAAEITERAIMAALSVAREDATEEEMRVEFERTLVSEGARPDFTVIAFGDRTALVNAQPSRRRLRKGDAIRFDVGCVYEHYHSDISRMAVLGGATEKLSTCYNAILRGHEKMIEMVRPEVRVSDIFKEAVKTIRKSGLPNFRRHHCGHGIGVQGYDRPLISESSQDVLENGMVLCLEPPYYELGWGGVQVEDTAVVTEDGAQLLTSSERQLISL